MEEYTGRITKQGSAITTFADLWNAYCAVRSGQWAKKTKEDLRYLFAKHVIPIAGSQPPREVTLTLFLLPALPLRLVLFTPVASRGAAVISYWWRGNASEWRLWLIACAATLGRLSIFFVRA